MKTHGFIIGMSMAFPLLATAQTPAKTPAPAQLRPTTTGKIAEAVAANRPRATSAAVRATTSMRAGGDGTRGGGETIELGNRLELRDLVERSVCEWKTGDDVIVATPYFETILSNIERLDWYFAMALRSEIRSLDFCVTGPLVRVQTEDDDSLTAVVTEGASQVAIRLLDSVYIDATIYDRMSERSRGYLLLHEVMHSFLGHPEVRRNQKLRSIVKAIEGLEAGRNATRRQFHLQLSRNSLAFPLSVGQLGADRKALEFALSSFEKKLSLLAAESDPAKVFEAIKAVELDRVWAPHHDILSGATPLVLTETALYLDDPRMLQVLTSSPKLAKSVLARAYILANETDHPQVSNWLATQADLARLVRVTLTDLAQRQAMVVDGRIYIPGQELMAASGDQATPASSLRALQSTTADEISPEVLSYLQLLEKFLAAGDLRSAQALTVESELFYDAFGINRVGQEISHLSNASAFEKEVTQRNVRVMAIALWNYVETTLLRGESLKNWKLIKKDINFTQLGYKF